MKEHAVLSSLGRFGVRLGLGSMRGLLEELGNPQHACPMIHVAGTNGKGSVVRTLGALLRSRGLRVGEYTSPHLQQVNERIWVDGREISDADLNGLILELDEVRRRFVRQGGAGGEVEEERALTYFEMMTAAAFLHFARVGVDVGVIEVGLGGRLDATNVLAPVSTAITSIGLDHVEQLGHDHASIAAEKAGIVQKGVPVVVGPLSPAAMRTVRTIAHERGATLVAPEADYRVNVEKDGSVRYAGLHWQLEGLTLALGGEHQVANLGVALSVAERLPPHLRPEMGSIAEALQTVRHAGRLEWLAPDVLVDCAHNGDGAVELAAALRALPPERRPKTLLLGMSADKDARAVVVALAPLFERVLTTHCSHPRAASAGELAQKVVDVGVPMLPGGPVEQALPLARGFGPVVVAGSIFLVGAVRDLMGKA